MFADNMNVQFDGFIRNLGTYGEKYGCQTDTVEHGVMTAPDKVLTAEAQLPYRRYITTGELARLAGVTIKGDRFPAHIVGRVFSPRGILPVSLFPAGDKSLLERAGLENFWAKEIFYTFDLDQKNKAKKRTGFWASFFLQKPPNFPIIFTPKTQSGAEWFDPGFKKQWPTALPPLEREPCIRSHARGLLSRMDMDRIDGLQRDRTRLVATDVYVKREKQCTRHRLATPTYFHTHTSLEVDCSDALIRTIYNQALGEFCLPVKEPSSVTRTLSPAQSRVRFPQENISSTAISAKDENDFADKKTTFGTKRRTSLKRSLGAAIRKLFFCIPHRTK